MILAIETSSLVCGASLHAGGECLAERYLEQPRVHAEKLAVLVRDLLEEEGIRISELRAVAVSAGPGSFTGLRIGMSFAKGLVYPHRIPLAAVNSMEAFIAGTREDADPEQLPVWVIHSHRDHIYMADTGAVNIYYGKTGDIPVRYPECRQIITNGDIGIPGIASVKRPVLPSAVGNYYLEHLPGTATTDYDSLILEYGMNYKPKEWNTGDGKQVKDSH
ncbi:MAG: tRNA (adenosine(37)-N6)-threonylcarbamoyltransferase complex dimerization subunit type 1 TsaB [Candidatus Marinimicrobia bacterium]|nr:tRNA (adenosine(37)-N6)-threonylcarbamoyltransferase complex dimerization subunit type 1 TsaB [Candidatus Neomarinimicrobiota bacterium]